MLLDSTKVRGKCSLSHKIHLPFYVNDQYLDLFLDYFHGRDDVYAKRAGKPHPKTQKCGYYPCCVNYNSTLCQKRLKNDYSIACSTCQNQKYAGLNRDTLRAHLAGRRENCADVLGVYALRPDNTCYFLVFDFDCHESATFAQNGDAKESLPKDESSALEKAFMTDVRGLVGVLRSENIPHLVERSRSGNGAHVWFFFKEPVKASVARRFGSMLLQLSSLHSAIGSFKSYDRMIPTQDEIGDKKLGNLIALPLQGRALYHDCSAFLDDNLNPYYDQWRALSSTKKMSVDFVKNKIMVFGSTDGDEYLLPLNDSENDFQKIEEALHTSATRLSPKALGETQNLGAVLEHSGAGDLEAVSSCSGDDKLHVHKKVDVKSEPYQQDLFYDVSFRAKPTKKEIEFSADELNTALRLVISVENQLVFLKSAMGVTFANKLKRLAAFFNPVYFKNKALHHSNFNTPKFVTCYHENEDTLAIPRGLYDDLRAKLDKAKIAYSFCDNTRRGQKINVSFTGVLRDEQQQSVAALLKHHTGILHATTAFGKTAVGAYLISLLKVTTLIVVHSELIAANWQRELAKFLLFNEDLPVYATPSGRIKKRASHIGIYSGKKHALGNMVDVVMVQSLSAEGLKDALNNYGLCIVDECHHAAADTYYRSLDRINTSFFYGFTATHKREDGLDKKLRFMFGPVRYSFSALEGVARQGIPHFVLPIITEFSYKNRDEPLNYTHLLDELVLDEKRNLIIAKEVTTAILNHRTCLVLTTRVEHVRMLYELLKKAATCVRLMTGELTESERKACLAQLDSVGKDESVLLIATEQFAGEGFNFTRLDALFLTCPTANESKLTQFAGRLNRDHEGKQDVLLYDFCDELVPVLDRAFQKRCAVYKKIGYAVIPSLLGYRYE